MVLLKDCVLTQIKAMAVLAAIATVTPLRTYKKMAAVAVPKATRAINQKSTNMSTAVPKLVVAMPLVLLVDGKTRLRYIEEVTRVGWLSSCSRRLLIPQCQ